METKIDIIADNLNFPEGPAFDAEGHLWCVELKGGNLIRFDGKKIARYPTSGDPNGLAFDKNWLVWFCDADQCAIREFNSETDKFKTIVDKIDSTPLFKPNDLAFDTHSNLVFTNPGDSRTDPTGYVCCLTHDGELKKIAEEMFFPNGLCFVNDNSQLVIAETYKQRLWIGRWDIEKCEWINPEPFVSVGGSPGPDGMALGQDGLLYVAVYGSSQIKVVNLNGKIVTAYDLPGQNPTNCAFDPSGQLGLVVTEAEKGLLLSLPEVSKVR